jgi:uncharacterized protein YwgA
MDRLRNAAIITHLVQKLREQDSWCGETHIQKAAYFLKELLKVPINFDFILYKHGPFSFELRDELTSLRADGLLKLEFQIPPYGPRFAITEQSKLIQKCYSKTLDEYRKYIDFITEKFNYKDIMGLERLATALYVTCLKPNISVADRVAKLTELKPHVTHDSAEFAVRMVDEIVAECKEKHF